MKHKLGGPWEEGRPSLCETALKSVSWDMAASGLAISTHLSAT